MLGGMLGGEEEKPEVEAAEPLAGAEAFAAAVAAKLAGGDPGVARKTEIFLDKQAQLLDTQNRYLEEEHGLRMAHLRHQLAEENMRRFGLRLRVGFQFFLVLVATALGAVAIIMVYDAFHSRNVVIDLFEVAPGLAPPIPNGKIVAASILDRLTQLQAATRISAEKRGLSNAWTNEISIDVPEAGLSLGQIERVLKARLGHDEHIDGDLVRSESGGLALAVRGTGILPKSFTDKSGHLEALVNEAAEYIYGESEPGLFAKYLGDVDRGDEAIAFVKTHLQGASIAEQPILLNYWANAISVKAAPNATAEVLPLYQEAVRLKPDYWVGYNNLMLTLTELGDLEGVVRVGREMIKMSGGRPGKAPDDMYDLFDSALWDLRAQRAGVLADMMGTGGTTTTQSGAEGLRLAAIDARLHEPDTARLHLKTTVWNERSHADVALAASAQALIAEELDDFGAAAMAWDTYVEAYADPIVAIFYPNAICWSARTYEKNGQARKADAALSAVGTIAFVDCYRARADVLDLRGDWSGAQDWYAKTVKLSPSTPAGYYSWGVALAKHGDLVGAETKLKDANQRGPHWADPLKGWGDVLVKQGHNKEARAKYDEALKYAPNWKQLKEAREAAAKQKSRLRCSEAVARRLR